MGHIVWDWNGTLLDDLDLLVEATSSALNSLGEPPVDVDSYRTHHRRPLEHFYRSILGRELSEEEFATVGYAFNTTYTAILPRAELAVDALVALGRVKDQGFSQSLLSMWVHEQLGPLVDDFGLSSYFTRIDGLVGRDGASKTESLERHLNALEKELGASLERGDVTIIGDTMDDGSAATNAGINCVFVATGAQHSSDLQTVGWPVASSLSAALDLVLATEQSDHDKGNS